MADCDDCVAAAVYLVNLGERVFDNRLARIFVPSLTVSGILNDFTVMHEAKLEIAGRTNHVARRTNELREKVTVILIEERVILFLRAGRIVSVPGECIVVNIDFDDAVARSVERLDVEERVIVRAADYDCPVFTEAKRTLCVRILRKTQAADLVIGLAANERIFFAHHHARTATDLKRRVGERLFGIVAFGRLSTRSNVLNAQASVRECKRAREAAFSRHRVSHTL